MHYANFVFFTTSLHHMANRKKNSIKVFDTGCDQTPWLNVRGFL